MPIALDSKSPRTAGTRYAGICLAAAGQFPNANLILAWNAFNTRAFTHRATSSTFIAMIGQAAALAGLQVFDTPPFHVKGNAVVLGVVAVMPPVALGMSWWFWKLNRVRAATSASQRSFHCRHRVHALALMLELQSC
jgi:hypothetical protein